MKFLIDANIPKSVIDYLINNNFDVTDIKKVNITMPDVDIIKLAQKEQRIIITLDKDFIALIQYPKYQVSTIVIRLKNLQSENIISYLEELFEKQNQHLLNKSLTIINNDKADSFEFE